MNTSIENISEPIKAYDKIKNINWLFISTVVIPTLLAIAYFGFIASDVYISESRFVVRSPDKQNASPFSSFLKGTGFSSSQDDSYTVKEYMLSRDALSLLNDKLSIKEAYSSKDVDIFSRFSGLAFWDTSFEALYQYYISQVEIELDADCPLEAAKTALKWLREGDDCSQFYVQAEATKVDEETGLVINETLYSVDLSEDDEHAVLPVMNYKPLINLM